MAIIWKTFLFLYSFLQPPLQPQGRYSEPDNRDWRGRSAQFPNSGESKEVGGRFDSRQQEDNQFNRQDQLNSQFARAQISSNQGVISLLTNNIIMILYVSQYLCKSGCLCLVILKCYWCEHQNIILAIELDIYLCILLF